MKINEAVKGDQIVNVGYHFRVICSVSRYLYANLEIGISRFSHFLVSTSNYRQILIHDILLH
jgi:hypothetical protein